MDPIKYLKRFDAYPVEENYLQDLAKLQSLHMQHIPFENLDVIRKVPIYLNLENIYDKVVNQHRGGYCYELNGLFCWLLQQIGFDAKMISATVMKPDGSYAKPDTHAAIIVELDAPYLVDAGFGDSTISPIPLGGERHTDNSGTYRIDEIETDVYELTRENDGDEKVLYRFTLDEKKLEDFHEGCIFNQVSEESTFTHDDIVTKATPEGRVTLTGTTLTRTIDGRKEKQELTEAEKMKMLEEEFGIVLDTEKPLRI
ncbi:arylamine N-acetyltransferase family protein [Planococcus halotolerans]|uniref:Arylamine N-acetyltransferase n=1 Tax=Planococcus halotolerans TaxID=2233542 RepID=A0A365L0S7_9BACL|nr:arylamine N-acetyltransferase [Planococcus halotolerans]QHJ71281.1 arylamine N-acetyltransferase [Planococcus halotolerans]RAZ78957.1 arylamine N-acetyltransferase [Planococcus halotolerans]